MTALDCIIRALRKIRVYGAGEDPSAADSEDCLLALNQMLSGWGINGIDLAHIDLALSDVIDVPDDHLEAITLSLAERIAADFGTQVSPVDAAIADQARSALRAYHFNIATIGIDHPTVQDVPLGRGV